MSAKKGKAEVDYVWAEKEGYEPRKFTMIQLEAMGSEYDGWKVTSEPKEPKEVTEAKGKAVSTSKTKATSKPKNSDATTGKAKSTGGSDNINPERAGSESSSQGSDGDTKTD